MKIIVTLAILGLLGGCATPASIIEHVNNTKHWDYGRVSTALCTQVNTAPTWEAYNATDEFSCLVNMANGDKLKLSESAKYLNYKSNFEKLKAQMDKLTAPPEYVRVITKNVGDHKVQAEYDAQTGEFYKFKKQAVYEFDTLVGILPDNFKEIHDQVLPVMNDMISLDICSEGEATKEIENTRFSISCSGQTGRGLFIYWHGCDEYSVYCQVVRFTLGELLLLEEAKNELESSTLYL